MQIQLQILLNAEISNSPFAAASLLFTRQIIQDRLKPVEGNLADKFKLQDKIQQQDQLHEMDQQKLYSPDTQSTKVVPGVGNGKPKQRTTSESGNDTNLDLTPQPTGKADKALRNGVGSLSSSQQSKSTQSDNGQTKSGSPNGSSNGSGGKH